MLAELSKSCAATLAAPPSTCAGNMSKKRFMTYTCITGNTEQLICNGDNSILLTKITAAQSDVALSNHRVRGIYFLAVVFAATIISDYE